MKREDILSIANDICNLFEPHFSKYMVVGSLRRKKQEINDIDIVAIPKSQERWYIDKIQDLINSLDPEGITEAKALGKSGVSRFSKGNKIKRFQVNGVMIDLYLANEMTYGTLILIRTGSEQHNIKLTTEAIKRGMKLFANGSGLCKTAIVEGKETITDVIQNTEEGILRELCGKYIEPEMREA